MKISADTPISSLMNYRNVVSLCNQFVSKVNNFKQTSGNTLNSELSAGLSGDNCLVAGEAILEDTGAKTIMSINNINTGVTSKIISKAREKRREELTILRERIISKIVSLKNSKAILQNKKNPDSSDIENINTLQKSIDKYEQKKVQVESELGSL